MTDLTVVLNPIETLATPSRVDTKCFGDSGGCVTKNLLVEGKGFNVSGMQEANHTLGVFADRKPNVRGVRNGLDAVGPIMVWTTSILLTVSFSVSVVWCYYSRIRKRFAFYIFSNKF